MGVLDHFDNVEQGVEWLWILSRVAAAAALLDEQFYITLSKVAPISAWAIYLRISESAF